MLILLSVAVLMTALYLVFNILLPEMSKPVAVAPKKVLDPDFIEYSGADERDKRIEKLESLLAEKNKNIHLLQTELKVLQVQVYNFDSVRSLLEEEVHRLRDINRVFRSELGLPSTSPRENSFK